LTSSAHVQRNAAAPEAADLALEASGDGVLTMGAMTIGGKMIAEDLVPVPGDQRRAAAGTVGGIPRSVMDVASVDIMEPRLQGDLPRPGQGGSGGGRHIGHAVVWVKSGEMQRYVGAEVVHDPCAFGADFGLGIIVAGNEQGGDFQPGGGLPDNIFQSFQHRGEMGARQSVIEFIGKGLKIDIGGVHLGKEIPPGLGVHIARRHCHRLNPLGVAGIGGVHGVFGKDDGVVVGEGDAFAAQGLGRLRNGRRAGLILQAVHLPGFGNVPVLAELAGEIAARCAKGQDAAARIKVVQGLFLDGVHTEAGGSSIGGEHHLIAYPLTDEAGTALAVIEAAVAGTEVALDAAVLQPMPVMGGMLPFGMFGVFGIHVAFPAGAWGSRHFSTW
jgi:hypothetical protein